MGWVGLGDQRQNARTVGSSFCFYSTQNQNTGFPLDSSVGEIGLDFRCRLKGSGCACVRLLYRLGLAWLGFRKLPHAYLKVLYTGVAKVDLTRYRDVPAR